MHTAEEHTISAVQKASTPSQHTANDTLAATMPPAFIPACSSPVDCSGSQGMFDCVLHSLQEASWPSHARRSGVISAMSPGSGYFNFGVQLSRKSCLTQVTKELPHVCRDLNALFRFLFPPLAGIPFVSHVTASAFCMPTLQMYRALRTFHCR